MRYPSVPPAVPSKQPRLDETSVPEGMTAGSTTTDSPTFSVVPRGDDLVEGLGCDDPEVTPHFSSLAIE